MRNKQYYQIFVDSRDVAEVHIFGDITAYPQNDTDVSLYNLSEELMRLGDVSQINVYINSYGGEVMEGLAIYNALKRQKAHVTTYCDGSACSIASVIFMAGDERIMCKPSFLMIHDAWSTSVGNADELRKQADDLDVITSASVCAYLEHVNISEEKLRKLMKAESWLTHYDALEMGFATGIEQADTSGKPSQSVRARAFEMLANCVKMESAPDDDAEDKPAEQKPDGATAPDDGDNKKSGELPADDNKNNDEKDEKEVNEPAQRWSGFFNAIFRV